MKALLASARAVKYDRCSQAMRSRTGWEPGAVCAGRRAAQTAPITAEMLWRDAMRMTRGRAEHSPRPSDRSC